MLIKGQFKIKDNLMEKKPDLGLSHSKCRVSVIVVFKLALKIIFYPPCFQMKPKDVYKYINISCFLVFFNQ